MKPYQNDKIYVNRNVCPAKDHSVSPFNQLSKGTLGTLYRFPIFKTLKDAAFYRFL